MLGRSGSFRKVAGSLGLLGAWLMNGAILTQFHYLSPYSVGAEWTLAGPK